MQSHHELKKLTEKILCQVHHFSYPLHDDLRQSSRTKERQAQNPFRHRKSIKKFRISSRHDHIDPFKENRKLDPNSLKRNIIREYFLREKSDILGRIRITSAGNPS